MGQELRQAQGYRDQAHTGHWYLYERGSIYDPKIKRSRKKSGRCLGKITPEGLVASVSRKERAERARVAGFTAAG